MLGQTTQLPNSKPFPKLQKSILQLLGPSVIFVALSLNGGEMLLWPDLVSRYGLQLLWIIPLILVLQYAVNIEIERYTFTTGKNTLTALTEKFSFLSPFFVLSIVVSLFWPAWVLTAGNILAILVGFPEFSTIISFCLLVIIILIWSFQKSYLVIEKTTKIGLLLLLTMILYVILSKFNLSLFQNAFGNVFIPDDKSDKMLYLSALAFGGVAGVLNFVQSNWVIKKGYGACDSDSLRIDYQLEESKINWKSWYKILLKEHFILFWGGNMVGIFLIAILSIFTIRGTNLKGFSILSYQVQSLSNTFPLLGFVWGCCIFLLFFMAQITILDAAGHLLDSLNASRLKNNNFSQIVGCLGLVILVFIIFNPSFNQPSLLLQISASLSALIMGIYPILLLILNMDTLPNYAKPKLWNKVLVIFCSLFYLIMTVWAFII